MADLIQTPSQTVGPFFAIGLPWDDGPDVVPNNTPGAFWIRGAVFDGNGVPVPDALVETWQADPNGRFNDDIFDLHYRLRVQDEGPRTTLVTNTAVTGARWDGSSYELDLHHEETDEDFGLRTDGLVLATGYAAQVPEFLEPVRDRIRWDDQGRFAASSTYSVDHGDREIYVQNAEEHTHGFVAPDLGMGAYRNSVLVAALTGREVYPIEKRIAVQSFGVPDHLRRSDHP